MSGSRKPALISFAPDVTAGMCQAGYWFYGHGAGARILMSRKQIEEFNRKCTEIPETRRNCLEEIQEWFDGEALKRELLKTEFPQGLYLNHSPVTEKFYQRIRQNVESALVTEKMSLRYGVAVNRTLIKSCPCREFLADEPDDDEWDQTAVCGVQVNEPLVLYFETADGCFSYVKSRYCAGWVPSGDIGICADRNQWKEAMKIENPLMVTGERIWLEPSAAFPGSSEKCLTMGTVLALCSGETGPVAGRMPWNNYVVKLPCRTEDGRLRMEKALIPMSRDVHEGYLDLTPDRILIQAFKCLGNRYGWGGMLNSQDCSSFVQEVYRCFGLLLPRDTGWQAAMPAKSISMEGMSEEEKGKILETFLPGTILLFKGHEMLYLGMESKRYYVINDVSSLLGEEGGQKQRLRVRSVIVNSLDIRRPNGKTWLSEINLAVMPWEVV